MQFILSISYELVADHNVAVLRRGQVALMGLRLTKSFDAGQHHLKVIFDIG